MVASELEHMIRDKVIMFIFMMVMLMRLIVTCRQASQGWALVMISSGLPLPVVTSSSSSSLTSATKEQDSKLSISKTNTILSLDMIPFYGM